MIFKTERPFELRKGDLHWIASFNAMASPCEILLRCESKSEADQLASLAVSEAYRIERTYSRYRDDNIIHAINNNNGALIDVDEELARLLDYAGQCYKLSDGLFDITSGVLRKAWRFDGKDFTPDGGLIKSLLEIVGWDKVQWDGRALRLRPGMQIDLGGIGKEYAADRVAELLFQTSEISLLVNFGGDIRAIACGPDTPPWIVGIENPDRSNGAVGEINLTNGGVATSGDLNRFCLVNGVRMGHILNPKSGWPVTGAPRNVTVLGDYCVEAGFLATMAILNGVEAEKFLKSQNAKGHCIR
jgi:thiamine biosynthesis lipoprotein